jgi:hypothetical protein
LPTFIKIYFTLGLPKKNNFKKKQLILWLPELFLQADFGFLFKIANLKLKEKTTK